jgi:hypothetical protein
MKTTITVILLLLAALASGCTAPAPQEPAAPPAPAAAIPDLVGTWTGPSEGYDEGTGFSDYRDLNLRMIVTEQKGRIFAGRILFVVNGTDAAAEFAGAIARDGRSFIMAEKGGGYCFGEMAGPDEIDILYVEDGSPYSASIDRFLRQK